MKTRLFAGTLVAFFALSASADAPLSVGYSADEGSETICNALRAELSLVGVETQRMAEAPLRCRDGSRIEFDSDEYLQTWNMSESPRDSVLVSIAEFVRATLLHPLEVPSVPVTGAPDRDTANEFGARLPRPPSRARMEVHRLRRLLNERAREERRRSWEAEEARRRHAERRRLHLTLTARTAFELGGGSLARGVLGGVGVGFDHESGHRLALVGEFQLIGPQSLEYRNDHLSLEGALRFAKIARRAALFLYPRLGVVRTRIYRSTATRGGFGEMIQWHGLVGGELGVEFRLHPRAFLTLRGGAVFYTHAGEAEVGGIPQSLGGSRGRFAVAVRVNL